MTRSTRGRKKDVNSMSYCAEAYGYHRSFFYLIKKQQPEKFELLSGLDDDFNISTKKYLEYVREVISDASFIARRVSPSDLKRLFDLIGINYTSSNRHRGFTYYRNLFRGMNQSYVSDYDLFTIPYKYISYSEDLIAHLSYLGSSVRLN